MFIQIIWIRLPFFLLDLKKLFYHLCVLWMLIFLYMLQLFLQFVDFCKHHLWYVLLVWEFYIFMLLNLSAYPIMIFRFPFLPRKVICLTGLWQIFSQIFMCFSHIFIFYILILTEFIFVFIWGRNLNFSLIDRQLEQNSLILG